MEGDAAYFAQRASESAAAAHRATDPRARAAHRAMGERYKELAQAIQENERRTGVADVITRLLRPR